MENTRFDAPLIGSMPNHNKQQEIPKTEEWNLWQQDI